MNADQVVSLLDTALRLEPIAFDLVLKFASSLKGKSADEVRALNDSLSSQLDSELDADQAELDANVAAKKKS